MDGGSGLPQGLRPFHGRLYKGEGDPRRGTDRTPPPAATPPPGRAAGPSSPPPGAPPCTCASLGGTAPAALGPLLEIRSLMAHLFWPLMAHIGCAITSMPLVANSNGAH